MADSEPLTPGEFILALALAFKGHDAAKSLRREARHVRKGGIRYNALRGMADGLDKGADAPIRGVERWCVTLPVAVFVLHLPLF
jgi:hypothetical protein